MKKFLPYNKKLKDVAKELRRQGILSEIILWSYLKNKQMRGLDFNRQKPIDNYIVDFYCPRLGLVIEIDGITHGFKVEYDQVRERKLESFGLTVLHFSDTSVKRDINSVLSGIDGWVIERLAQIDQHTHKKTTHPVAIAPPLSRGELN